MVKKNLFKKGFTLIEVSLALALAGYAMVWTYSQISMGLKMQRRSIILMNAVFLAKIKMAQLDATPKLETTTASGEIPGYTGYRFETEIKEEELDLLKLSESSTKTKKPEDLLGVNQNAKMDELMKKRGQAKGSKTGGLIKIFRIKVKIKYPTGTGEEEYVAESLKSSTF